MHHDILRVGRWWPALALGGLLTAGCGLESLFQQVGGEDHDRPVSTLSGTVALAEPEFRVLGPKGEELELLDVRVREDGYEIDLASAEYQNLRVVAFRGEVILKGLVDRLPEEGGTDGVDLDVRSTVETLVVEAMASAEIARRLAEDPDAEIAGLLTFVSPDVVCITGKRLDADFDQGALGDLLAMAERLLARANTDVTTETRVFRIPELVIDEATGELVVAQSGLNRSWIGRNAFDYDEDGRLNQTTEAFDLAMLGVVGAYELTAPPDPDRVRTVFAVDFNEGKLNGACGSISRFRWVTDEPGRQMFFVGGIHESSPVQDPEVDAMLGNTGGWTPNQIRMYDDGTNGDRVAGDDIWSIAFDLPRDVRIGYKYTWGKQGDPWTGTEEWPGNQRILEVVDVNEDGYVYRFDNFGDEASNKDRANLNPRSGGALDWDEDLDGDGHPEAREGPVNVNNTCDTADDVWVTPTWVPALTISCDEFQAD